MDRKWYCKWSCDTMRDHEHLSRAKKNCHTKKSLSSLSSSSVGKLERVRSTPLQQIIKLKPMENQITSIYVKYMASPKCNSWLNSAVFYREGLSESTGASRSYHFFIVHAVSCGDTHLHSGVFPPFGKSLCTPIRNN